MMQARKKVNYLNSKICSECGGKCCKRAPGVCLPPDFDRPLLASLIKAFKSGKYAIDWWEGDPREGMNRLDCAYFIRPAVKPDMGSIYGKKPYPLFHPLWQGECIFLDTTGCILLPENRPAGCRLLEPLRSKENCVTRIPGYSPHMNTKRIATLKWLRHTKTILKAAKIAEENKCQ